MSSIYLFVFWLCCFILPSEVFVSGFNLSPKHALIFKDPSGQEGSYFGYTVAFQQDGWLFVGAPRGNSTHPNHLNITEPGIVYQCQIEGDAKCTSQVLDSAGKGLDETKRYRQHKHNAWTGGSLDVMDGKNGKIVVCGPLWVNLYNEAKEREFVTGICYVTEVSDFEKNAEKLMPFNNYSYMFYKKQPNDTDDVRKIAYNYAYGQSGMSVHFTREGDEMIIGAPGVMDWTGTVVRYKMNDYKTPVIPNPLRTPMVRNFTYLGYSVSSGNFLSGKNKTYYVGGAPRGGTEYQGKVYIFDIHNSTRENEYRLEVIQELEGKQVGEYFGAAVCVLDVNGDGLDDIIVGAPHYGGTKTWDQGRVHVYVTRNASESITFLKEILGSRQSGAQYGAAVSSLGDINRDGYNDFVVGAPYEESGTGVIYVYHGGKTGPSVEVSQRIVGRQILPGIRGFGISFSRSLDIDANKYTDIAVGAYKSGHAVVLKTRPVIRYEARITSEVSSIGLNASRFNVEACITYKGKDTPLTVDTIVILTLDRNYNRVTPRNIRESFRVSMDLLMCKTYQMRIESSLQDFSKPIELRMQYMLQDDSSGDAFCKSCPMVDPKKPSSVTSFLPYATGCLKDDSCTPSVSITAEFVHVALPLAIGSQPTVTLNVTIQNSEEPAFLAYALIPLSASCPLIRVPHRCEIVDNVDGEVAQPSPEKKLKCLVGNPVLKGNKTTLQLDFDVKDVATGTEEIVFNLNVTSAGRELTPHDNIKNLTLSLITQADIGLSGFSGADKIVFSKWKEMNETQTEFSHIYELKNLGPSPLEKVDLEFEIPVSYAGKKCFFQISDIKARKDADIVRCVKRSDTCSMKLLKSANVPINTEPTNTTEQFELGDQTATQTEDITGTSKIDDTTESSNTSKPEDTLQKFRSTYIETDLAGPKSTHQPEEILSIDCKDPETTCVTVSCSMHGPIRSTSRMVVVFGISALNEELENILGSRKAIIFSTTGKAKVTSPKNVQQTQKNRPDETHVNTIFHGKITTATFNPVAFALAAAGSVLLLLLIILLLWKLGFFKRKRVEEHYKALIHKQRDE